MAGHLSAGDSRKGTLREGSFIGEPVRYVNLQTPNVNYS